MTNPPPPFSPHPQIHSSLPNEQVRLTLLLLLPPTVRKHSGGDGDEGGERGRGGLGGRGGLLLDHLAELGRRGLPGRGRQARGGAGELAEGGGAEHWASGVGVGWWARGGREGGGVEVGWSEVEGRTGLNRPAARPGVGTDSAPPSGHGQHRGAATE